MRKCKYWNMTREMTFGDYFSYLCILYQKYTRNHKNEWNWLIIHTYPYKMIKRNWNSPILLWCHSKHTSSSLYIPRATPLPENIEIIAIKIRAIDCNWSWHHCKKKLIWMLFVSLGRLFFQHNNSRNHVVRLQFVWKRESCHELYLRPVWRQMNSKQYGSWADKNKRCKTAIIR